MKTAPSVLGCDRFLLAGEATNQKKGHGCVKIDTPWPFSILILRDARAPKRRAILKPFCDAIWGPSQASNPRQSRESQPFVRLPPLYSPFSSIVTPYNRLRNYIFPFIGTTPIARLEVQDIMAVLRPLEMKRCYETSRRVLQIINQVFRYAVITGRARHNIAADLRGALSPRRVTHRAAVLTPEKVGQLLRDIDAYDGYFPLVCALKLAPLVFTRPTELRAAQWGEFDLEAAEWRIPAERMKMRRPHIVPLSAQSVAILRELQPWTGTGRYLFSFCAHGSASPV